MVAEVKAFAAFTLAQAVLFRTPPSSVQPLTLTLASLNDCSDSDLSEPPTDLDMMDSELDSSPAPVLRADEASKRKRSSRGSDHTSSCKKRRQRTNDEDTEKEDSDNADTAEDWFEDTEAEYEIVVGDISKFEGLPKELIQTVALQISKDRDLVSLMAVCRRFAAALNPENSDVWKARFTSKYDHPIVSGLFDYCWAYKERTLVLGNFIDFGNGQDRRLPLQLQVLQDMVYETYNAVGLKPTTAKEDIIAASANLALLSSPWTSPAMHTFLSSAFYNFGAHKYGEPHMLFDVLHLTFSSLLLSRNSKMATTVSNGRDRYDIARVYNWNQDFSTLFIRLPQDQQLVKPNGSSLFPGLKGYKVPPVKYNLNMHSLLHIRNFWHSHLLDRSRVYEDHAGISEITYASMAKGLAELGHIPRQWTSALQDFYSNSNHISTKWYGHYSCIYHWPTTLRDLVDRQTNAEDWQKVDPIALDFSASTTDSYVWPNILADIPALKNCTPNWNAGQDASPVCIRGIAPFLDMEPLRNRSSNEVEDLDEVDVVSTSTTSEKPNKGKKTANMTDPRSVTYHPYKALRVRGIIQSLPSSPTPHPASFLASSSRSQSRSKTKANLKDKPDAGFGAQPSSAKYTVEPAIPIPGFKRIFMVLYKPTTRYLVQVLEHMMGDYGNPWTIAVGQSLMNQQPAANTANAVTSATNETNATNNANAAPTNDQAAPATANNIQALFANGVDSAQAEIELKKYLNTLLYGTHEIDARKKDGTRKLEKNEDGIYDFATEQVMNFPLEMVGREGIGAMEDAYHGVTTTGDKKVKVQHDQLQWEDIEYAYVYEGVLTPGDKIMLGRWWRVGLNGMEINEGCEVDCEGMGVKVVVDEKGGRDGVGVPMVRDFEAEEAAAEAERLGGDEGGEGAEKEVKEKWRKSKGLERGPFVFWC